jgi:hypothetical protein
MKLLIFKRNLFLMLFSVIVFGQVIGQSNSGYLTKDGTWCWFSDPRAIKVGDFIITGWVKSNGTIEAAKLNTVEYKCGTSELYYELEADDHDNPAFATTASGEIIVMYTRHSKKDLFINYLSNPKGDFDFSRRGRE